MRHGPWSKTHSRPMVRCRDVTFWYIRVQKRELMHIHASCAHQRNKKNKKIAIFFSVVILFFQLEPIPMPQTITTVTTLTTGPVLSAAISTSASINPLAPEGSGQDDGDSIPAVNSTRRVEQQMPLQNLFRGTSTSYTPVVLDVGAVPDAQ